MTGRIAYRRIAHLHTRRRLLALLGSFVALPAARARGACAATPAQTEGPYFVDTRLERSDIRVDPADGSRRPGVPLALALRIVDGGCIPLAGALVDLWHCDADGAYSDVTDPHFSTRGRRFLRGYQTTGADGVARFTTIYPGWYPGRAVHIHFKVRATDASGRPLEFTSQLYFDDALSDRVYARAPYARRGPGRLRNEDDGIYRRGGGRLLLAPVETAEGYAAQFEVVLPAA